MAALPTGTVTFLFTDLEGSTRLWEEHPEAMQDALARHDAIVRDAIESHHGHVVKTTGDGAHAAFATASDAVDAAVAAQLALARRRVGRDRSLARAHGHPHRRGRAARRRLLRHRAQPRRADHVGRARRPDRGVADHQRSPPRRARSSSSTSASTASATSVSRNESSRSSIRICRSEFPPLRSVENFPTQPAAADHVVRRPRGRHGRGDRGARDARASSPSPVSAASARPASRSRSPPSCCPSSATARGSCELGPLERSRRDCPTSSPAALVDPATPRHVDGREHRRRAAQQGTPRRARQLRAPRSRPPRESVDDDRAGVPRGSSPRDQPRRTRHSRRASR